MYNSLASLYIRKKQFAEAEDLCRKAIALDSSRPDAYLNLARVYNAQHASDEALEVLRAALPEARSFPFRNTTRDWRRMLRRSAALPTRTRRCTLWRLTRTLARSISSAAPPSTGAWRKLSTKGRPGRRRSAYEGSGQDRERPKVERPFLWIDRPDLTVFRRCWAAARQTGYRRVARRRPDLP